MDLVISFSGDKSAVYGAAAGAVTALVSTYFAMYVIVLGAILNAQLSASGHSWRFWASKGSADAPVATSASGVSEPGS